MGDVRCCPGGWKIIIMASRFNSGAESRYSAIDGEALGVVWAQEKCRFFIHGCPNLWIFTDHKPLVPIFKTKDLADIANGRLRKLVERACAWGEFEIAHIPGLKNSIADAGSRYPEQPSDVSPWEAEGRHPKTKTEVKAWKQTGI